MINKLGLIMGIVGLILSLIWGSLYYKNKKNTRELIQKGEIALVELERIAKLKQDSISLEVKKRDSTIKNLADAQRKDKEALNKSVQLGKSFASDLRKAKANRDTSEYYAKCDSLAENMVILEIENNAYQNKVDLLNITYQKQLSAKDSLLEIKEKLYSELRTAFNGSILEKDELKQEKIKLDMQLQRSRRTTRLVAAIGAAAAGAVYLSTR